MKKLKYILIIFGIFGSFQAVANAASLDCYYDTTYGNGQYRYHINVDESHNISINDVESFTSFYGDELTYKHFLTNSETTLTCPSTLYMAYRTYPSGSFSICYSEDYCKAMDIGTVNSSLDTQASSAPIELPKDQGKTFTCEYENDGSALAESGGSKILMAVSNNQVSFSTSYSGPSAGGVSTYRLNPTEDFGVPDSCLDYVYIRCHKGNFTCEVGRETNANFTLGAYLGTHKAALSDSETIKSGDDSGASTPSDDNKFNPEKLCEKGNCDISLENFCKTNTVARTFKFIGLLFYIAKILVPGIIIVVGIINLFKIMTSGKEEDAKKLAKGIFIRIIVGIGIFLLPGIIDTIYSVASDIISDNKGSAFDNCEACLLTPMSSDCYIEETSNND